MTKLAKILVLALWLLGQWLGNAHSYLPSDVGNDASPFLALEKHQVGNCDYDGGKIPGIVSKTLALTTTGFPSRSNEANLPTLAYDVDLVPIFLGKCDFLAAERSIAGTPGTVTGGSSTVLGKNMMEGMGLPRGTKWTGYQAQHIIPAEMGSHPVIQKIGMELDNAGNGMFLRGADEMSSTMSRHNGCHSVYNEVVERALSRMDPSLSVEELESQVYGLQQKLRGLQGQGTPLYPSQGATVDLWERLLNN